MEQIYDKANNLVGITKIPEILVPKNWESGTGKELMIIHVNDTTVMLKVYQKSQRKDKKEGILSRLNFLRFFR